MKRERVKGFAEVIVARNVGDGISYLIQGCGLGGLRHNSILLNWPHLWRQQDKGQKEFIDTMRIASERQLAVMIVKGIDQFPENDDRLGGTIDIWWIVHEGGLLMLLPFLLTQGKVWKKSRLRIFTVAQIEDNSIQIKKDMEKFIYQLRIPAEVKVVEMPSSDISAYTYERTLLMEQRNALLDQLNIKRTSLTPQMIMDQAHHSRSNQQRPSPGSAAIAIEDVKEEEISEEKKKMDVVEEDEKKDANDRRSASAAADHSLKNISGKDDLPLSIGTRNLTSSGKGSQSLTVQPNTQNVRRMHTAIRMNQVIKDESSTAKLIILNLPGPPKDRSGEENYMSFLEVLTEGLDRILMLRGGGKEVITIYS